MASRFVYFVFTMLASVKDRKFYCSKCQRSAFRVLKVHSHLSPTKLLPVVKGTGAKAKGGRGRLREREGGWGYKGNRELCGRVNEHITH